MEHISETESDQDYDSMSSPEELKRKSKSLAAKPNFLGEEMKELEKERVVKKRKLNDEVEK